KPSTKDIAEHLQYLKPANVVSIFGELWSEEDEISLLQSWTSKEEQMSKAFSEEQLHLWKDTTYHWGIGMEESVPSGLHLSVQDSSVIQRGQKYTGLPRQLWTLFQTCVLLPPFRTTYPFFRYVLAYVVEKRLRDSPDKPDKPEMADLLSAAVAEPMG